MAILACQSLLKFPMEVNDRIESFVLGEHHQAFLLKYGRGVVCRPCRESASLEGPPPSVPGFEIFAWEVDFRHLKPGMQINMYNSWRTFLLNSVSDSAFTYLRDGIETSMTFNFLYKAILFVESPGACMRSVGRDRDVAEDE